MSSASAILVVILSVFLALFLLLAIVLTIYLIQLTRQIRRVTNTAERAVDKIESTVAGVSKVASPLFVAEVLGRYYRKFMKSKKGSK